MSIIRVMADRIENGRVLLSQDERHHLVKVRRAEEGWRFEALDGQGRVFHCLLQKDSERGWHGEIAEIEEGRGESSLDLVLALSLIRKDLFEWALQKATELGVQAIWPLFTQRTEIRLDERRAAKKLDRWNRILREAVKQCGRSVVPILEAPRTLEDAVASIGWKSALLLDEEGGRSLKKIVSRLESPIILFIGPEGGWTEDERELLSGENFHRASLGPRILRAETAPLATIAILQHELGDL